MESSWSLAKEWIKNHEGYRSSVYNCSNGYPTIGYGHKIRQDEEFSSIDEEEAEELLEQDMQSLCSKVSNHVKNYSDLSSVRQAVLMDMIFNLGEFGFSKFAKMINALENEDYRKAANEMKDSKWYRETGRRSKHLVDCMENDDAYSPDDY